MRKKLVVFGALILGLICLLAGAGAEGRGLRTKIPVPKKTEIAAPSGTPGRRSMLSNDRGEDTAVTCEEKTWTLSTEEAALGDQFVYAVGILDGTHPDEDGRQVADTLYQSQAVADTSFSYTFYETGEYTLFIIPVLDGREREDLTIYRMITVSRGSGTNPLEQKVSEVAAACRRENDFETARAINDWLCDHVTYDNSFTYYSAESALLRGVTVCNGYTRAFEKVAEACGLDAARACGTAGGEDHAWNAVKMDGFWYQVDVTWDDNVDQPYYCYFGLTDSLIGGMRHHLEYYANGFSCVCDHLEDNYYIHTGKWETIMARDSMPGIQAQIDRGLGNVEQNLGKAYTDETGSGYWTGSDAFHLYGNVLAWAYTKKEWSKAGNAGILRGIFSYDSDKKVLTGSFEGMNVSELEESYTTGDEIRVNAFCAGMTEGKALRRELRWQENGEADSEVLYSQESAGTESEDVIRLWEEGSYTLTVTLLQENVEKESVCRDFTVSASGYQYLNYQMPTFILKPEDGSNYELKLAYPKGNEYISPDMVDVFVFDSSDSEEPLWKFEKQAPEDIFAFPVTVGNRMELKITAYKAGCHKRTFTEKDIPVVASRLDAPGAEVPETILAGAPLILKLAGTQNAESYRIVVEDAEYGYSVTTAYFGNTGKVTVAPRGLDKGTYRVLITARGEGYGESEEAVYPLEVTGERPAAPVVIAPEGMLKMYDRAWFTVQADNMTAAVLDGYGAEVYQAQEGSARIPVTANNWSAYRFRGLIGGAWSELSEPVKLDITPWVQPDQVPGPEVTMQPSLSRGSSLTVKVGPVDGADDYSFGLVKYPTGWSPDSQDEWNEYNYAEQIIYEEVFDIADGGFTIDGCFLMETGMYGISVNAAGNGFDYYLCHTTKYLEVTENGDLPAAPTVTLEGDADGQLLFGTTTFLVNTGGGADRVYGYINREEDSGIDGNPVIIEADASEKNCVYEWENTRTGNFTAVFSVSRNGVWSDTSAPIAFTVLAEDWNEERILVTDVAEAEIGDSIHVSWEPLEADWIYAYADINGQMLYEKELDGSAASFMVDTSGAENGGRLFLQAEARAAGRYRMYMDADKDVILLDPALKIGAEATAYDPETGMLTLRLTNATADRLRIRMDGEEERMYGNVNASGTFTLTLPVESMKTKVQIANYDTDEKHWGSWSAPVAGCQAVVPEDRTLRLPAGLTVIGAEAFAGGDFEAVIIPDGCIRVEDGAFLNCARLMLVSYPKGMALDPKKIFDDPEKIVLIER